jgi:DNA gyrase subunit A
MDDQVGNFELRRLENRAGILRTILKGIDQFDAVTEIIRSSESVHAAHLALMDLLDADQVGAAAVLDLQWRRLAPANRRKLAAEHDELAARITELTLGAEEG